MMGHLSWIASWIHDLAPVATVLRDAFRATVFLICWRQARQVRLRQEATARFERGNLILSQICPRHWLPRDHTAIGPGMAQWCGCTLEERQIWALAMNGYLAPQEALTINLSRRGLL